MAPLSMPVDHLVGGLQVLTCLLIASECKPAVLCATQDPQERSQAEQYLRVFSQSTEYIAHCKARLPNVSVL